MAIFILVLVEIFFYFIPAFIGWNKENSSGILAVNLILGWTLLGWVAALVWAISSLTKNNIGNMNAQDVAM